MNDHKFTTSKTATYSTLGNPKIAKHILFVLHGYGQLSRFFIRKFQSLNENYFIVAPEGLHRFYLNGTSGRVGASWMTKEQRNNDIHDYIRYLDDLWKEVSNNYSFDTKTLLGFSQGGATASRWLEFGSFKASTIILWGAVFPSDLGQNWDLTFKSTTNYFVIGNEDPYFSPEKIERQVQFFEEKNVTFTTVIFNGKHEIDQPTLLNICS